MDPRNIVVEEVFSQLSPADEQILISIPYRIGLYVSFSDVTGGWEAQEREQQSLISILQQFSQDFYKTEFTQKVLMDTLQARSQWPTWSTGIERLPADAAHIKTILAPLLMEEELKAFKVVLVDIAMTVAMTFRESEGDDSDQPHRVPVVREILTRIMGGGHDNPLEHTHISHSEKSALHAVMAALDYHRS